MLLKKYSQDLKKLCFKINYGDDGQYSLVKGHEPKTN